MKKRWRWRGKEGENSEEERENLNEPMNERILEENREESSNWDQAGSDSGPQESIGSIRPVDFWEETEVRTRMGILTKARTKRQIKEGDLLKKFNGKSAGAKAYGELQETIVPDKGFEPDALMHPTVDFWRTQQGWGEFLLHGGEEGFVELTREFFCNIDEKARTTWVRGHTLDISPEYLNRFLGTPNHLDEFLEGDILSRRAKTKRNAVYRVIANSLTKEPVTTNTFPPTELKVHFMPTYEFYMAKIRPSSHPQSTSGNILMGFAKLWHGLKLNVGQHIFEVMTTRIKHKQALCYPNLIRRICIDQGVDLDDFVGEITVVMNPPIRVPYLRNRERVMYTLPHLPEVSNIQSSFISVDQAPSVQKKDQMPPPAPKRRRKTRADEGSSRVNVELPEEAAHPIDEERGIPTLAPAPVQQRSSFRLLPTSQNVSQLPADSHMLEIVSSMSQTMANSVKSLADVIIMDKEEQRRKEEEKERRREEERRRIEEERRKAEEEKQKRDEEFRQMLLDRDDQHRRIWETTLKQQTALMQVLVASLSKPPPPPADDAGPSTQAADPKDLSLS